MASKQELSDAYKGIYQNKEVPYKIVQLVVEQMKAFLLGDGYQKKLQLLAIDSTQQANFNTKLEEINLFPLLNDLYSEDVLVYGEAYVDCSNQQLRQIRVANVQQVLVDPANPLQIVYLKERREVYNPDRNNYEFITVEHFLQAATPSSDELSILELPTYQYFIKVGSSEPVLQGDHIPIIRVVNNLTGRESISPIDRIIHAQAEYNEVRARINLYGKHQKPQMYTVGTSGAAIMGRTNASQPETVDTATGSAAFQTSFTNDAASIIHLPISTACLEAGIVPKIGYLQPVDSPYLERQRLIILQDIYNLTGVMVLELQNARSASSSSSLSVLYEPLQRATLNRASYLIQAIELILKELSISILYRVELPDMLPRDLEDKRLQIEAVKNKLISRKRYLMDEVGLTKEEALKELEQLDSEKGLNIQYSGAIVDSLDASNEDIIPVLEQSAIE